MPALPGNILTFRPWRNCIASLLALRCACWREVLVAQALLFTPVRVPVRFARSKTTLDRRANRHISWLGLRGAQARVPLLLELMKTSLSGRITNFNNKVR